MALRIVISTHGLAEASVAQRPCAGGGMGRTGIVAVRKGPKSSFSWSVIGYFLP